MKLQKTVYYNDLYGTCEISLNFSLLVKKTWLTNKLLKNDRSNKCAFLKHEIIKSISDDLSHGYKCAQ